MVGAVVNIAQVQTIINLGKRGNAPAKLLGTNTPSRINEIKLTKLTMEPAIERAERVANSGG